jgi:SPOR domain
LGDKGIYFRALVGPFASSGEAGELCSSLKAAGGQCIVQRN